MSKKVLNFINQILKKISYLRLFYLNTNNLLEDALKKTSLLAWDPWILVESNGYRLFYLVAEKSNEQFFIKKNVIYSAFSTDLKKWKNIGVALCPSKKPSWDDGRLMSGNTLKHDGKYYLFYSAAGSGRKMMCEKIGLATSSDGISWKRNSSNPFLVPNNKIYFQKNNAHQQWRDPYVYYDELTKKYYLIFAAEARYENNHGYRGTIGVAVSEKIDTDYKLLDPLLKPVSKFNLGSLFYELERPQLVYNNKRYYLFFSCWSKHIDPSLLKKINKSNNFDSFLFCYSSKKILGPYLPLGKYGVIDEFKKSGIYGINFLKKSNKDKYFTIYGWHQKKFKLSIFSNIKLSLNKK